MQRVMCRNTLVSAMLGRNLRGGANNEKDGSVTVSLEGESASFVEQLREFQRERKPLNDWGCLLESV